MKKIILFALLLFFVAACSSEEQADTSSNTGQEKMQSSHSASVPSGTRELAAFKMIFFLDPNGGPCRMQVSILNDMAKELSGKVDIQYVQTIVPSDREIFYKYGVRGLPTILLADASGKEIKRMTPGVRQASEIRTLIQSIPKT